MFTYILSFKISSIFILFASLFKYVQLLFAYFVAEQLKASFRGYPLLGKVISLPKDYKGLVLQETINPSNEDKDRNIYTTHAFNKLIYWNWDKQPSQNDAFIAALDWIDIAEAVSTFVSQNISLNF